MRVRVSITLAICAAFLAFDQAGRGQAPAGSRESAWRANNLGVAELEQYDYEGASRSFREALRLSPDLAAAHLNLAIALYYGAHAAEAAAEARIAVAALPASPTAHYVSGLIARADDRADDAAAEFERVLAIDPADAGSSVQLGQLRLQQRQFVEALRLFTTALAAEPYNVTAAYNAGLALTRAGRADEGAQAMQRFESLRDSVYGVTYAQTYLAQGRYAEAIASTGAEPDLVEAATPDVAFVDATTSRLPAAGPGAAAPPQEAETAGAVMLFDADQDSDLDLLAVGDGPARFFRNQNGRFTDDTARSGFAAVVRAAGAVAGDYDNDGRIDVFVFGDDGFRLLHQQGDATFGDATASAQLPRPPVRPRTAAFADFDHDGDLDLVVAGATLQFLRNNGNGRFADQTAGVGLTATIERPIAVAPTDFDNRRDIDLLVADGARGPLLFRNMRDGTFREWAADAGLTAASAPLSALAIADVGKDGYPDAFLGTPSGAGRFAMSDGRGRFRMTAAPTETTDARAAQFVDYDNDGLLDLLVVSSGGRLRLLRNVGGERWTDASARAGFDAVVPGADGPFAQVAIGDLDRDGDPDVVVRTTRGGLRVLQNDGGSRQATLGVTLTARVSNRSRVGAKVEIRAGSLRQTIETSSASPAVAPADILFGLGRRTAADVVRVLWPSGILQAETTFEGPANGTTRTVAVTELDRKPSSCPYLFTWNGSRFEFVTDFMGGGELGDWIAPSVWSQPDPDEYVRIRGDQLKPRDGRYDIRVTNELEETLFVDRVQLLAVDHPTNVDVFPNEGLRQPPRPAFTLMSVRDVHAPRRAEDEHGHDVLPLVAAIDRRYPDDFARLPIRGYAAPHALTLDLGAVDRPVLLLTGWTDYAFSSDNVAASQAGIEMALPSVQVKDASGEWRTAIEDLGFPVGRPQTIAVDLAGTFPSASREVRILTSMRIFWDQVQVGSRAPAGTVRLTRLDAERADLRWRGFSTEESPDGAEPFGYDYGRVSTVLPWKTLAGRYTREGDVRPLLARVDDMFVISRPGDELSLSFSARTLPAPAAGWTRTFLLFAHGYSKEMNPRSATTDVIGPLPFNGMRGYPYGSDEHYPRTRAHREYLDRYNTREVARVLPPLAIGSAAEPAGARR